jgi:hypothetical protein
VVVSVRAQIAESYREGLWLSLFCSGITEFLPCCAEAAEKMVQLIPEILLTDQAPSKMAHRETFYTSIYLLTKLSRRLG